MNMENPLPYDGLNRTYGGDANTDTINIINNSNIINNVNNSNNSNNSNDEDGDDNDDNDDDGGDDDNELFHSCMSATAMFTSDTDNAGDAGQAGDCGGAEDVRHAADAAAAAATVDAAGGGVDRDANENVNNSRNVCTIVHKGNGGGGRREHVEDGKVLPSSMKGDSVHPSDSLSRHDNFAESLSKTSSDATPAKEMKEKVPSVTAATAVTTATMNSKFTASISDTTTNARKEHSNEVRTTTEISNTDRQSELVSQQSPSSHPPLTNNLSNSSNTTRHSNKSNATNHTNHTNHTHQTTHTNTSSRTNTSASTHTSASSWSVLSGTARPIVRSISFSRDRTCLLLATSLGVRIRVLDHLELGNCRLRDSDVYDVFLPPTGASFAQIHRRSYDASLLAVVRPDNPRCLFLYHVHPTANHANNSANANKTSGRSLGNANAYNTNMSCPTRPPNPQNQIAALPLSAAIKRVEIQTKVMVAITVDGRLHVFHLLSTTSISTSSTATIKPMYIQTMNILHPTDTLRNISRGLDIFNSGAYFDLSPSGCNSGVGNGHTNEGVGSVYLVCKSFNETAGTVRVYDPTLVHETERIAGFSGDVSVGGRSVTSAKSASVSLGSNSFSSSRKIRRRIHLHTTINAHEHAVTRMVLSGSSGGSNTSTYLATTSTKGTTIRLFALPTGEFLWEWHRGSRPCQIHSLGWNDGCDWLVVYGSSGTVHLFDWQNGGPDGVAGQTEQVGKMDQLSQLTQQLTTEGNDIHTNNRTTVENPIDFETVREGQPRNETGVEPNPNVQKVGKMKKPLVRRLKDSVRKHASQVAQVAQVTQIGQVVGQVGQVGQDGTPGKHRSFARIRVPLGASNLPPPATTTSKSKEAASANATCKSGGTPQVPYLVVALLGKSCSGGPGGSGGSGGKESGFHSAKASVQEESVVMCSIDGVLRQYCTKRDGSSVLVQSEDVLL